MWLLLRLVVYILLAGGLSTAIWYVFELKYDVGYFASQEARESVVVTEAQSAELNSSAYRVDLIAYAIYGALITGLCGLVCPKVGSTTSRLRGLLGGFVLGGLAGCAMAALGHWFDDAVAMPRDPMLYWLQRWALMLAALGLAIGIATVMGGAKGGSQSEPIVGALLGSIGAAILYCLFSGEFTPVESHHTIYPGFASNRWLILTLAAVLSGSGAIVLGHRVPPTRPETDEVVPVT